jgi:predicted AAA+ superfamily ATPase
MGGQSKVTKPLADYVDQGLDIVRDGLRKPLNDRMSNLLGLDWVERVLSQMPEKMRRESSGPSAAMDDPSFLLYCITNQAYFAPAFQGALDYTHKTYAFEIRETRNKWAHKQKFAASEVLQTLGYMRDLLEALGSVEESTKVSELWEELVRQIADEKRRGQARKGEATLGLSPDAGAGLKPWWQVAIPREDVRLDRQSDASFAADLSVVHSGGGPLEYRDPKVFFERTYITAGLRALIATAAQQLARTGKGDPVVDLQTNFGGGKTHSLLALYHLAGASDPLGISAIGEILQAEGIQDFPRVQRAVFVGNRVGPAEIRRTKDGIAIHTMWGDLAHQLAGAEGYKLVAESDIAGTSPGSDLFSQVLRLNEKASKSSMILIDEFVTYARQLRREGDSTERPLPAGTFEANVSFIQALTESASEVPGALVVFSLPSSSTETGSIAAQRGMSEVEAALQQSNIEKDAVITKTVQRVASPWKPADAFESFEIVRRRLFEPLEGDGLSARDAVIGAFLAAYRKHENELPDQMKSGNYREFMERSYPIHPDLFDRLYKDWSSIEKFQRTRGVLRLLAKVVHELWTRQDASPMILTGTVPLDDPQVRSDLNRYLSTAWDPVVSSDIEGDGSASAVIDQENPLYGRTFMTRRVARAIFLGSAPAGDAPNRGLDTKQIALSCMLPNEKPSDFSSALARLSRGASHLYSDQARYWFALQPTVNKTADQRKSSIKSEELDAELLRQLEASVKSEAGWKTYFAKVFVAPASEAEVPEEDDLGLVVIGPEHPRKPGGSSPAHEFALKVLKSRSGGQRQNRNCLVFLAADESRLVEARDAAGSYLAWKWVCEQAEDRSLILDASQARTALAQRDNWAKSLTAALADCYIWLLDPVQPEDNTGLALNEIRTANGVGLYIRAGKKLADSERLLVQYAGVRLQLTLADDRLKSLWDGNGGIKITNLQESFLRYPYMPRLRDLNVLDLAIADAVSGMLIDSGFGYSDGWDDTRHGWLNMQHGPAVTPNSHSGFIVKPEIAKPYLRSVEAGTPAVLPEDERSNVSPQPAVLKSYRGQFNVSAESFSRMSSDIALEVLPHLVSAPGADVQIKIEITAVAAQGFPEKAVKTVAQNTSALKADDSEFKS